MKIESLRDLFEIELRYAYDCEQKLVKKGLPLMIEASSSIGLRNVLEQHLEETSNRVARLERVFSVARRETETEGNDVLDELTSSVKDTIGGIDESYLRDATLIVGETRLSAMKWHCMDRSSPLLSNSGTTTLQLSGSKPSMRRSKPTPS